MIWQFSNKRVYSYNFKRLLMGKKIKLEAEDPIIKKNPKLEKRKQKRAEERKKLEE